jgi:eukaryotic-like serine/threonine-protein kinase
VNPAEQLEGSVLDGGWVIHDKLSTTDAQERRACTVCYAGKGPAGEDVFVKAVDFRHVDLEGDTEWLGRMVGQYNNEKAIAALCADESLSRVIRLLAHGKVEVAGSAVQYLVFEREDDSIHQKVEEYSPGFAAVADRLLLLHGVASAVRQLHGVSTAHHDIALRNTVARKRDGRIQLCDLGAASCRDMAAPPHDSHSMIGDIAHAPIEAHYNYEHPDWAGRHFGCDCYLVGSLLYELLTSAPLTFAMLVSVPKEISPEHWKGERYADLVPHLREALEATLDGSMDLFPAEIAEEVATIIRELCDPDPAMRGHPLSANGGPGRYSLERYVSTFDRLTLKMRLALRVAQSA